MMIEKSFKNYFMVKYYLYYTINVYKGNKLGNMFMCAYFLKYLIKSDSKNIKIIVFFSSNYR